MSKEIQLDIQFDITNFKMVRDPWHSSVVSFGRKTMMLYSNELNLPSVYADLTPYFSNMHAKGDCKFSLITKRRHILDPCKCILLRWKKSGFPLINGFLWLYLEICFLNKSHAHLFKLWRLLIDKHIQAWGQFIT